MGGVTELDADFVVRKTGVIDEGIVPGGVKIDAIIVIRVGITYEHVQEGVSELDTDVVVRKTGVIDEGIVPGEVLVDAIIVIRAAIVEQCIMI